MVDIELRELRLFLVLAEELHFGRTAERLGLTTSRASQALRALERKLGGRRLFDRTSRVVTLTAAGHALHDELAPIVTGLDNTLTRARAGGRPGGDPPRRRQRRIRDTRPERSGHALRRCTRRRRRAN